MSNAVSAEPITCPSCEYRYPSSEAICPMCGKAAPAIEPIQQLSAVPEGFSGADCEAYPSSSASQRPPHAALRRLVPVVVALIVCMAVTLSFYKAHKGSLPKESNSPSELTATSAQAKMENAAEPHIAHNPARGVPHVIAAKLGTAQTTNAAKEDDPVQLWKAVKRGNVSAEVALANLYLKGEAVPQNCGQAHTLLHAASMKGSQAADTLLKGSYAERCE